MSTSTVIEQVNCIDKTKSNALTLLVWQQEKHLACKKTILLKHSFLGGTSPKLE